uniref:Uncharacterized protein n=1 Tax=Schistocephalus solidus TaxID=70667 RepID=A0A0X3PBB5_SCHSO
MAPTITFCFLASLFCLALSQTNELKIYRKPGIKINNEDISIEFDAQAIRNACIDPSKLCSEINNHRQTFTIPANTNIPPGTTNIMINRLQDSGASIQINDATPPKGTISLGRLDVQNNKVTRNGVFTAQYRITGITPKLELQNLKKETVVRLNGPMGSEPVSFILAAGNDGSGETFKLTVLPSTGTKSGTPTAIVGLTFVFLMLHKLLA